MSRLQYDARVTDIGHDKPFISTYIVKRKDDDGWFPENLMVLLQVPGRDDVVPVPPEQFKVPHRGSVNPPPLGGWDEVL